MSTIPRSFDKLRFLKTLFLQSETGPNYYKEVPLSEILAVDSAKTHSGERKTKKITLVWYLVGG